MGPDVSVVVSTYNGSAFIARGLASIFAQTQVPNEIVVVDDCSTDDTAAIVKAMATNAPVPVKLISLSKNSGGPSRPLNIGIEAAKGDVILLLDQDDLMRPRRLEAQLDALMAYPQCTIVIGQFAIIDYAEDDTPMWTVPQFHDLTDHIDPKSDYSVIESSVAFRPLLSRNYAASCSNFCFTKAVWQNLGRFDESVRTCNDLDLMLRATMAGPIAIVNEKLFDYRRHPGSLHQQDVAKSLLEATMVRLRAASAKPEWAREELESLRYSALILANAALRKGDFWGLRAIAETLARHNGLAAVKRAVDNKTQSVKDLLRGH